MKHLRKFNESETPKYEMELKDYFYDFTDNGFIVDIEGNVIKGKYTGNYDFTDSIEMFLDTSTKLKHYFGITKTSFNNSMTSTSFVIEISNKMDDINSIEVTQKKSGKKLKIKIQGYMSYWDRHIQLYGTDINNKSYNLQWYSGDKKNYIDENASFKVNGVNCLIDLENATKVYNIMLNNTDYINGTTLLCFKKLIKPELLVR